jgi:hypothetical protein
MSASADLLKTASAAAHHVVAHTDSGPAFRQLIRNFADALARVPDYPATEFSPLAIEQLSSKAEHVIAAIERHIEDHPDRTAARQSLAEAIDDVRHRIEELNRWRRHYLQSPTT